MRVKNLNRMQNAAALGVFFRFEEYARFLRNLSTLRNSLTREKYWRFCICSSRAVRISIGVLLVNPIRLFSLPLSWGSPYMTEILLTGTLRLK